MPINLSTETISQPDNNSQQSVRPKSEQLVAHTQNVPPSAVSWHQLGNRPTPSAQHQPSAHPQATDNVPSGFPTTVHMSSLSPHPPNVPNASSQTNMYDNATTILVSPNMASRMPTDTPTSQDYSHVPQASTMPPKAHIPTYPSMYSSPYGLHIPATTVVSSETNLTGHPLSVRAPVSSHYGVPNAMYSRPSDSFLPPAPPVLSGTSFPHETDPVQAHQTFNDQQHFLHSSCAIVPTPPTPVYAPMTVPVYHGSNMYAQQPFPMQQPQIAPPWVAHQQNSNSHNSAMNMPQPSFTQTHQVRNVQLFSGGPDCRILIEDWIRDMQYLLDAGGMPANLGFATVVRHLSGEARRLVLNLPPNEQTTGRAFEELRAEYSDMQTSLDPLADFYERCQHHGESVCSYAIALEATLRSVEAAQFGGQPFPDRDSKLTRQFLRGLSDEEVYHRLAPMKPRLLSFRELQAELRDLARETKKFQSQPKAKKTYAQAQFTSASFNQSGENSRADKANKLNSDMSELTAMVKKLMSSQEDQSNRLIQLEARVGASPHAVPQRSQGSSDTEVRGVVCYRCGKPGHIARLCRTMMMDEVAPAENGAETRQDLNA